MTEAATIPAAQVKELRDLTGVKMMACKEALVECNGNIDQAQEYLRKKGIATAGAKSNRAASEGAIHAYIHHGSRVGVMIEVNCETDFVARNELFTELQNNLCLHIAAAVPVAVSRDQIDTALVEKERGIIVAQLSGTGASKPAAIIAKIVDGKMNKFFGERCLLEQKYVKDDKMTVGDLVKQTITRLGENIVVRRFVRWEL